MGEGGGEERKRERMLESTAGRAVGVVRWGGGCCWVGWLLLSGGVMLVVK